MLYYYYLVDKETVAWKLKPKVLYSRLCYFFTAEEPGFIPVLAWLQSHGINQHIASSSFNESASESSFDESDCWSSTSQKNVDKVALSRFSPYNFIGKYNRFKDKITWFIIPIMPLISPINMDES